MSDFLTTFYLRYCSCGVNNKMCGKSAMCLKSQNLLCISQILDWFNLVWFVWHMYKKTDLKNHHILVLTLPGNMRNALTRSTLVFLIMVQAKVKYIISIYFFTIILKMVAFLESILHEPYQIGITVANATFWWVSTWLPWFSSSKLMLLL